MSNDWNVYLQWKGTTVCFDWYCPTPECEGSDHIDYDMPFPGAFECPECHTMWKMGTEVTLTALPADYPYADSGVLRQVEPPEDEYAGVWKTRYEVDFEARQAAYRVEYAHEPEPSPEPLPPEEWRRRIQDMPRQPSGIDLAVTQAEIDAWLSFPSNDEKRPASRLGEAGQSDAGEDA